MSFQYRLKRVCGQVYTNGNIIFSPDGNTLLSPVGNRVTVFDMVQHSCTTLPFETRKNIRRMCMSNNGRFLIVIDVDGAGLLINFPRRVVLERLAFKRKVYDIKFSLNDAYIALTSDNGCDIYKTPSMRREFAPLTLCRKISGHDDTVVCFDWSEDSQSIIMGSKDLSARIYYRIASKHMAMTTLVGHRDAIVGAYFNSDGERAYTVARDGAVMSWEFQYGERQLIEGKVKKEGKSKFKSKEKKTKMHDDDDDDDDVEDSEDEDEVDEDEDEGVEENDNTSIVKSRRGSRWVNSSRDFLWDPHSHVTSSNFNKSTNLLIVGFNTGVFGIYEMPGCVNIHKISVSQSTLNTASINNSGEWIAMGSSRLGQLLVWEWQSESYVLKQQGHLYGLNSVDISSDGQYMATAGEDSKVKLWSTASGFCFVTFTEHTAPVTGVKFVGKGTGKAILSSSLDGTVRAHDLMRYKNFRTMTTPTPVQFTCLAVDASGEIVCAGALDPFTIYVWALQTGQLLDELTGHEGPIACLDFSQGTSVLASGSWDGTCKLWNVYENKCIETVEHGCDCLAVAFRPDGKEVCTAATNGNIYFWDVETGAQTGVIEGKRDISGGRLTTDAVTADKSSRSKHFTTVTYSADGTLILAGGHSKYACIYSVTSKILVKRFQLSHNRSLEGILDELRSDRLVDGISLDNLAVGDSDDEHLATSVLPGVTKGTSAANDGSRTTRADIMSSCVRFSPTGREWVAATTQGLQIFGLDDDMIFAPTDLDVNITPQAVEAALARQEYSLAVNMALHLNESTVLKKAVDCVVVESIPLVVQTVDARMLRELLRFIAGEVLASRHIEYYLRWTWEVLRTHSNILQSDSMPFKESLRSLIRAVASHEKEVMRICDENHFSLSFLLSQSSRSSQFNSNTMVEAEGDNAIEDGVDDDGNEIAEGGQGTSRLNNNQEDEDDSLQEKKHKKKKDGKKSEKGKHMEINAQEEKKEKPSQEKSKKSKKQRLHDDDERGANEEEEVEEFDDQVKKKVKTNSKSQRRVAFSA